MRFNVGIIAVAVSVVLTMLVALTSAQPHQHGRRHGHKRSPDPDLVETVSVPGPTIVMFEFEGKIIPEKYVCEGIFNGTLNWASGTVNPPNCEGYSYTAVATAAPSATSSYHSTEAAVTSVTAGAVSSSQASEIATSLSAGADPSAPGTATSTSQAAVEQPTSVSSISNSGLTGYDLQIASNSNVSVEFKDGVLDCGTFPSAYGAIPINWQGIGGWSGVQYATIKGGYVTYITTAIHGDKCENKHDGSTTFCSYACPPGYQKSQWPSTQGSAAMAVSVGGLRCGTDNKLYLTNPGLSKHICIQGSNNVYIKNNLDTNDCICRTDYPGTESETVPLNVQSKGISPLTCPDASTYYRHLGMSTTAEYYVNMKGVPVDKACIWGTDGSHEGNWAPLVIGAGRDTFGSTWISIQSTIQNNPSSYKDLDFTIELQGNFGGSKCFYTKGHYCSRGSPSHYNPSDCQTTSTNEVPGCTVSRLPNPSGEADRADCIHKVEIFSGNATYVFSD